MENFSVLKDQGYWCARFKHPKTGKRTPSKRLCKLARQLGYPNPDEERNERKASFLAYDIAKDALEQGLIFSLPQSGMLAVDFINDYWDYNKEGGYIAMRNRRHPTGNAISESYAYGMKAKFNYHIAKHLKGLRLTEITPELLEEIQDRLFTEKNPKTKRYFTNSTIKSTMASIKLPLKEAYRKRYIKINPAVFLEPVTVSNEVKRGMPSFVQVSNVLTWLKNNATTAIYLATATCALCGIRQGEARALYTSDIDLETMGNVALIRVSKSFHNNATKSTKGKKTRIVPCPKWLAAELVNYGNSNPIEDCPYALWSTFRPELPISGDNLSNWYCDAFKALGYPLEDKEGLPITFHSLRHFYVTTLRGQIPTDTFEYIIGHESLSVTDQYTHAESQVLRYGDMITKAFQGLA